MVKIECFFKIKTMFKVLSLLVLCSSTFAIYDDTSLLSKITDPESEEKVIGIGMCKGSYYAFFNVPVYYKVKFEKDGLDDYHISDSSNSSAEKDLIQIDETSGLIGYLCPTNPKCQKFEVTDAYIALFEIKRDKEDDENYARTEDKCFLAVHRFNKEAEVFNLFTFTRVSSGKKTGNSFVGVPYSPCSSRSSGHSIFPLNMNFDSCDDAHYEECKRIKNVLVEPWSGVRLTLPSPDWDPSPDQIDKLKKMLMNDYKFAFCIDYKVFILDNSGKIHSLSELNTVLVYYGYKFTVFNYGIRWFYRKYRYSTLQNLFTPISMVGGLKHFFTVVLHNILWHSVHRPLVAIPLLICICLCFWFCIIRCLCCKRKRRKRRGHMNGWNTSNSWSSKSKNRQLSNLGLCSSRARGVSPRPSSGSTRLRTKSSLLRPSFSISKKSHLKIPSSTESHKNQAFQE